MDANETHGPAALHGLTEGAVDAAAVSPRRARGGDGTPRWHALRVTYCRELALKALLDAEGIENFIPMRHREVVEGGRRKLALAPAVHNLVFARSTQGRIEELRSRPGMRLPVSFIVDCVTRLPVVVPEGQMRSFMLVAGGGAGEVLYIDPAELRLCRGQRVRITGGPLEGVVGEFVRIRHDRRVVVDVQGLMAVATAFVHPSLVEPLDEAGAPLPDP